MNAEHAVKDLFAQFQTSENGLTTDAARTNLIRYGSNILKPKKKTDLLTLFFTQFKSPIILILISASVLSLILNNSTDAIVILVIVFVSSLLGFWQESGATNAIKKLLSIVQVKTNVLRDGEQESIFVEQIVPGDVVILTAGDMIPGDGIILESRDLFVNEATLTGETYPVEKHTEQNILQTITKERKNLLFMGSHVISGTAKALITKTSINTEIGRISERLKFRPPETEFEHGARKFGYFLMEITLILVIAIFAINSYFGRPIMDAFLFSTALAVGLTPQLLPAVISINLSKGAKKMASKKVIVKKLASIENLGSMNVLCCDKTGTLTKGEIQIKSALDAGGKENQKIRIFAYLNAFFETGFTNPIDEAIRIQCKFDVMDFLKLDEIPYDFIRKRLSILVSYRNESLLITKGAFNNVFAACNRVELTSDNIIPISTIKETLEKQFEELSGNGFRIIGVSYKKITKSQISKEDENEMIFLGFLVFFDPIKPGIKDVINNLKHLGVSTKVISGDNRFVVKYVSEQIGLSEHKMLTGGELRNISDEALLNQVNVVNVFAEIEPSQKERIILALKKSSNVVGFLGDGVNDAIALHAADVGISVEGAVDVAKESADIVLLEKDLEILADGVTLGRTTFVNTLKYVFMATSANFGNMFSMAGASLFLSFLPLLPKQILLENLMTDFPELTISTDKVDQKLIQQPRRWDIKFIRKFMVTFGFLSVVFDFLAFGVFILLHATEQEFRTGWFIESVISASVVVLIIRTQKPFFKSKPSSYLLLVTLFIVAVTVIFPFTPLAEIFGFTVIPASFYVSIAIIITLYVISAEIIKRKFYSLIRT
ncbi:MAG: magnesium-translocating P-type ATPase [Thaumarchaeota archaeon]|nr:magnesium-translocating P-type ATPase [Nitrososphaerota archaeon]